jgi:hypothetical protein
MRKKLFWIVGSVVVVILITTAVLIFVKPFGKSEEHATFIPVRWHEIGANWDGKKLVNDGGSDLRTKVYNIINEAERELNEKSYPSINEGSDKTGSITDNKNSDNNSNKNIWDLCAFDKVKYEWDSHAFLRHTNRLEGMTLDRINITNYRNKFAYEVYGDHQKDDNSKPIFNYKTFSQGLFMLMKNFPNIKIVNRYSGKVYLNEDDSLLIWYRTDYTPDNYPKQYNAKIDTDGTLLRDFQDFDFMEENGEMCFYKFFNIGKPGVWKIKNRVYEPDKVKYWDMEIIVDPAK